jgi:hypothetical protein
MLQTIVVIFCILSALESYALELYTESYILLQYKNIFDTKQRAFKSYTLLGPTSSLVFATKVCDRNRYSAGILGIKNKGEEFVFNNSQYGFSFYGGHVAIYDKFFLKTLILGDYMVGYGQGLILGSDYRQARSDFVLRILKNNNLGLAPHNSIDFFNQQSKLFCGIGLSCYLGYNLEFSAYYSNIYIEADIKNGFARSVPRTYSYSKKTLLLNEGNINEQIVGATVLYKHYQFNWGLNFIYLHYDIPIKPNVRNFDDPNKYLFAGTDNLNTSVFADYKLTKAHLFGELAFSKNMAKGVLVGLVTTMDKKFNSSYLFRHYDVDFHSIAGNAFRQNFSENRNEQGLYLGFYYKINERWSNNYFIDLFRFIKAKSYSKPVISGIDVSNKVSYNFYKVSWAWKILTKLRREQKVIIDQDASNYKANSKGNDYNKNLTKLFVDNKLNFSCKFNEVSRYNICFIVKHDILGKGNIVGVVCRHSLSYQWSKFLDAYFSLALFDLGKSPYKDAIYCYEKNLTYNSPFVMYLNTGIKFKILFVFCIYKFTFLELKYSLVYPLNVENKCFNKLGVQLNYVF